jgi:hypothetical protein
MLAAVGSETPFAPGAYSHPRMSLEAGAKRPAAKAPF